MNEADGHENFTETAGTDPDTLPGSSSSESWYAETHSHAADRAPSRIVVVSAARARGVSAETPLQFSQIASAETRSWMPRSTAGPGLCGLLLSRRLRARLDAGPRRLG